MWNLLVLSCKKREFNASVKIKNKTSEDAVSLFSDLLWLIIENMYENQHLCCILYLCWDSHHPLFPWSRRPPHGLTPSNENSSSPPLRLPLWMVNIPFTYCNLSTFIILSSASLDIFFHLLCSWKMCLFLLPLFPFWLCNTMLGNIIQSAQSRLNTISNIELISVNRLMQIHLLR